ncbi:MAG: hypothetical protein SVR94_19355, partial [Pseudomonadota bacterium]|nr:hypothetical protein [Pseudomonadota bacterium]
MKKFDICIVGSGITGTLVAEHFLSQGLRVLMLERGKDIYFPETPQQYWYEAWRAQPDNPNVYRNYWPQAEAYFDDLVAVENVHQRFGFHYNMKYGLGGSGAVWSGAAWRLTPEDFQTQSLFNYGRDWPLSYDDLAPYYAQVEQRFLTSGPQAEPHWPWDNHYPYPAFKQNYLDKVVTEILAPEFIVTPNAFSVRNTPPEAGGCVGAKTCVQKCPANARFRPDLHILYPYRHHEHLTLWFQSPALKLNLAPDNTIASITVLKNGEQLTEVQADYYFLAANTIENIRILHNSADNNQIVANSSGLLGHYFASHGALVLSITLDQPVFVGRGRPTTSSAINTLNHEQRQQFNAYMLEIWNQDWNVGLTPPAIMRHIRLQERHWGMTLFNQVRQAEHRFTATLIFEMEARQRNRVTLSEVKDHFNLPLAKV